MTFFPWVYGYFQCVCACVPAHVHVCDPKQIQATRGKQILKLLIHVHQNCFVLIKIMNCVIQCCTKLRSKWTENTVCCAKHPVNF